MNIGLVGVARGDLTSMTTEARDPSLRPGARAFDHHILRAPVLQRYKLPAITKYTRELNLGLWLGDYRLACYPGGANCDNFIICNLPLYLADSEWT